MHAMQPRHRSKCSAAAVRQRRPVEQLAHQVDPPARRVHLLAPQLVRGAGGQAEPAVHAVLDRRTDALLRPVRLRDSPAAPPRRSLIQITSGNRPGAIRCPGSNWSLTARISAQRRDAPGHPAAAGERRAHRGGRGQHGDTAARARRARRAAPRRTRPQARGLARRAEPDVEHTRAGGAGDRRRRSPASRAAASIASSTWPSADTQNDTRTSVSARRRRPARPGHHGGAVSDTSAGRLPAPEQVGHRRRRAATPSADPSRRTPTRIGPPGDGRLSSTAEATSGEFAAAATASHATGQRKRRTPPSRTPAPRAAGAAGTSPR